VWISNKTGILSAMLFLRQDMVGHTDANLV
jgi:hypothetical protein